MKDYHLYFRIAYDDDGKAILHPVLVSPDGDKRIEMKTHSQRMIYTVDQAAQLQSGIELALTIEEIGGLASLYEELMEVEAEEPLENPGGTDY